MNGLKITDVRVIPGDSAFLIDDGKTAVLCDAGFGFTGARIAKNVQNALGERTLDYIFLTHSHYDHVLGAPHLLKIYPDAKIVAGAYAASIFAKDSAKARMCDLDRKFALTCGTSEYEDLSDALRVDIAVQDGDTVQAGSMSFTAIALPGHTKCSMGFYLAEQKLLLGSETLGVFDGEQTIMPCCLVGYRLALDSIARVREMEIEHIVFPHLGLGDKAQTAYFLAHAAESLEKTAARLVALLQEENGEQQAMQYFRDTFYHGKIKEGYPIDAMLLNTSIMIDLTRRELLGTV